MPTCPVAMRKPVSTSAGSCATSQSPPGVRGGGRRVPVPRVGAHRAQHVQHAPRGEHRVRSRGAALKAAAARRRRLAGCFGV